MFSNFLFFFGNCSTGIEDFAIYKIAVVHISCSLTFPLSIKN